MRGNRLMRYLIAYLLRPLVKYSLEVKRVYFMLPPILIGVLALIHTIVDYKKYKKKTLKNYKKWHIRDFVIRFIVDVLGLIVMIVGTVILQIMIVSQ